MTEEKVNELIKLALKEKISVDLSIDRDGDKMVAEIEIKFYGESIHWTQDY